MEIELDALTAAVAAIDGVENGLMAALPEAGGVLAAPEVVAAIHRLCAAGRAARLARLADLTELADGLDQLRARWILTENTLAAVPQ